MADSFNSWFDINKTYIYAVINYVRNFSLLSFGEEAEEDEEETMVVSKVGVAHHFFTLLGGWGWSCIVLAEQCGCGTVTFIVILVGVAQVVFRLICEGRF